MILEINDVIVKPYVRMTRRGKYVNKQAKVYMRNKFVLQFKIKEDMRKRGHQMFPGQTPLWAKIFIQVPSSQGHRCDIDNIAKAILDACNNIVYPDDRWIDELEIKRVIGERNYFHLYADSSEERII